MQRKTIDAEELSDLKSVMTGIQASEGTIAVTSGLHPLYGALILVSAAGSHVVLGNDVNLIVGEGETLESDMVAQEAA